MLLSLVDATARYRSAPLAMRSLAGRPGHVMSERWTDQTAVGGSGAGTSLCLRDFLTLGGAFGSGTFSAERMSA
jgi:hypothetical protein